MASSASSTFNTTTAASTAAARPSAPSVATAPTGAPSKQAASVAIDLPDKPDFYDGKECQGYFADLNDVDRKEVCDVLTDTDTQLTELVGAINNYVQALVGREAALRKQLKELNEQAAAEEAFSGFVSKETAAGIQTTKAELDITATDLAELRKKVAGYKKLPGVIGQYNKYFEALRTVIQEKTSIPVASAPPGGLPPSGLPTSGLPTSVPVSLPDETTLPHRPEASPEETRASGREVVGARFGPEPVPMTQDDVEISNRQKRNNDVAVVRWQSSKKILAQAVGATTTQQLRNAINTLAPDDEQKLLNYVDALSISPDEKQKILASPIGITLKLRDIQLYILVRMYPYQRPPEADALKKTFELTFDEGLNAEAVTKMRKNWQEARSWIQMGQYGGLTDLINAHRTNPANDNITAALRNGIPDVVRPVVNVDPKEALQLMKDKQDPKEQLTALGEMVFPNNGTFQNQFKTAVEISWGDWLQQEFQELKLHAVASMLKIHQVENMTLRDIREFYTQHTGEAVDDETVDNLKNMATQMRAATQMKGAPQ